VSGADLLHLVQMAKADVKERFYYNGAVYRGQMEKELRQGKGVMTWLDGATYDGMWHNDMANGKGKFTHTNGDLYEGTAYITINNRVNRRVEER
jgi:hypothetical protein